MTRLFAEAIFHLSTQLLFIFTWWIANSSVLYQRTAISASHLAIYGFGLSKFKHRLNIVRQKCPETCPKKVSVHLTRVCPEIYLTYGRMRHTCIKMIMITPMLSNCVKLRILIRLILHANELYGIYDEN